MTGRVKGDTRPVQDRVPMHAADRRPSVSTAIIDGLFQLADMAPPASQQTREQGLAIAYLQQLKSWHQSDKVREKRKQARKNYTQELP